MTTREQRLKDAAFIDSLHEDGPSEWSIDQIRQWTENRYVGHNEYAQAAMRKLIAHIDAGHALMLRNMPHEHELIGLWDGKHGPAESRHSCDECAPLLAYLGIKAGSLRFVHGLGPKLSGYYPADTPVDRCGNALDKKSLGWDGER